MEAFAKELNASTVVLGDLAAVVQRCVDEEAAYAEHTRRLAALRAEHALLETQCVEAEAQVARDRVGLQNGLDGAASTLERSQGRPSTPLEYVLLEGAVHVLHVAGRAVALHGAVMRALALVVPPDADAEVMSGVVRDCVALCSLVPQCEGLPRVDAFVRALATEAQTAALDAVLCVVEHHLQRMGWSTPHWTGTAPQWWSERATAWVEWAISLDVHCGERFLGAPRTLRSLAPFLAPFRRKFAFHFLASDSATALPSAYRDASSHALQWIAGAAPFFAAHVQPLLALHAPTPAPVAVVELIRALSRLLVKRTKRDIVALLGGSAGRVDSEANATFFATVDEVFAWSATLELHYGYALCDASLVHVLLDAVLPDRASGVTQHWLALEQSHAMRVVDECTSLARTPGTEAVTKLLALLAERAEHRLRVLPAPWQRRAFVHEVQLAALSRFADSLQSDLVVVRDLALPGLAVEEFPLLRCLGDLGCALDEWAARPEYDQDGGALALQAEQLSSLAAAGTASAAATVAQHFLSQCGPWLGSRNWFYVTEAQAALLVGGLASRLDVSAELCVPFETLREWMRRASKCLGASLFTSFALACASLIDSGLLERLIVHDRPDMSLELASQLEFDMHVIFALWSLVADAPAQLFKRMGEALRVLRMQPNQLLSVRFVDALPGESQQQEVLRHYGIVNLSGLQVVALAKLRKDLD